MGNKKTPVLISPSLLDSESEKEVGIVCIIKDISSLKELERQNNEKMLMLAHAGRFAALGEMATGVAHELNQPLAIIRNNMQTLDYVPIDQLSVADRKDIIEGTIKQVDRASSIINHMKAFTKK